MLAGRGDLLSVTGEVAVVSKSPVTVNPTTTSGVGLILPDSYASASSRWMRKTSSEISRLTAVQLEEDGGCHFLMEARLAYRLDRLFVEAEGMGVLLAADIRRDRAL